MITKETLLGNLWGVLSSPMMNKIEECLEKEFTDIKKRMVFRKHLKDTADRFPNDFMYNSSVADALTAEMLIVNQTAKEFAEKLRPYMYKCYITDSDTKKEQILCYISETYLEEVRNYTKLNDILKQMLEMDEKMDTFEQTFLKCVGDIKRLLNQDEPFVRLINSLRAKQSSEDIFHYLYPGIKMYGRNEEMELLQGFLDTPGNVKFWALIGPGGIGKSKVAYNFYQKCNQELGWKAVYLSGDSLRDIVKMDQWVYDKNLLLIVDYAGTHAKELGEWLQKLAFVSKEDMKKIRILLLERQGFYTSQNRFGEEILTPPEWLQRIFKPCSEGECPDSEYVMELQYQLKEKPEMLVLKSLNQESYMDLIDGFSYSKSKKYLSMREKEEILTYLNRTLSTNNKDVVRPLFVLFVADAALEGKSYHEWDIEKLNQYIYRRNGDFWKKHIESEDLLTALKKVLIYTTAVKPWEIGSCLPEEMIEYENVIEKYLDESFEENQASDWINILTGQIAPNSRVLTALEPDIVGEFFVLEQLRNSTENKYRKWVKVFSENLSEFQEFFERCISDYGQLSGYDQQILRMIEALEKTVEQKKDKETEIGILAQLFRHFRKNVQQTKTKMMHQKLRQFCEKWYMTSEKAAEEYVKIFIEEHYAKGEQKREYLEILRKLYNRWPKSAIITKNYVFYLGRVGKSDYGRGNLAKGKAIEEELIAAIECWKTRNNDVDKSCLAALGQILAAACRMGEKANGIEILVQLSRSWDDETVAVSFMESLQDMIQAEYQMGKFEDGRELTEMLKDAINAWSGRSSFISWIAIDIIVTVLNTLYWKGTVGECEDFIECLCDLLEKMDDHMTGALWRGRNALETIAQKRSVSEQSHQRISEAQKVCDQKLKRCQNN